MNISACFTTTRDKETNSLKQAMEGFEFWFVLVRFLISILVFFVGEGDWKASPTEDIT